MTDTTPESGGGGSGGGVSRAAVRVWRAIIGGAKHVGTLLAAGVRGFFRHRGPQFSAAIAYYTLLSVVPIAIVFAAVFGLIVGEQEARTDVVNFVTDELPFSPKGRTELDQTIAGVTENAATFGIIGLVALLITASALMGSVRHAINVAFETGTRRPPLRAKGLDVLMLFGLGLLVVASFALTVVRDFAIDLGNDLGVPGEVLRGAMNASGNLIPLLLTAAAFAFAYKVFPTRHVRWRDIWLGVVFATIAYELAKGGFTLYLENFANYNAIYGALAGVVVFLVFVYASAIVLLVGAEMAALWPRVRAGEYDPGPTAIAGGGIRGLVRRLVGRPVEIGDGEGDGVRDGEARALEPEGGGKADVADEFSDGGARGDRDDARADRGHP